MNDRLQAALTGQPRRLAASGTDFPDLALAHYRVADFADLIRRTQQACRELETLALSLRVSAA